MVDIQAKDSQQLNAERLGVVEISIERLAAGYGGSPVLKAVDLSVSKGEFSGIVGPNGCGKTTLLRSISRALRPSSGTVRLKGSDIWDIPSREFAREVAVVPQDTVPAFDFSAFELVMMGRSPHLGRFQIEGAADREIVEQSMRQTGTLELANRQFAALSGGERQRVVIARALAQQSPVILLDEPTSHLDINYQFEILNLIRRLNRDRGMTVLIVLHDLNLAAQYCDRLVMLGEGEIKSVGSPEDVITSENVRNVYGAEVWVRRHPASGRPYVIAGMARPATSEDANRFDRRLRVHVICGGGTGAPVFAKLIRRGFDVTAGVLNIGDTDQEVAEALDIPYVSAPPFAAITDQASAENSRLAGESDVIVVSDAPYGQWNLPNLAAAKDVVALGKRVAFMRPETFRQRDFTGGDALDILESLEGSILHAETLDELMSILDSTNSQIGEGKD